MMSMRSAAALAAFAVCISGAAAASDARGGFERTLKVSGQVELNVHSGSGHVNVRAGETNEVHIVARIHASDHSWFGGDLLSPEEKVKRIEQKPPVEQNGNSIEVGRIEDRELQQNVSIDYDVDVPAETRLTARTGSGDMKLEGLAEEVNASTGSGSIRATHMGGGAKLNAGSGDIQLETLRGRVEVHTGSGTIRINGVTGDLEARAGSGDINVDGAPQDTVLETGSGHIRAKNLTGTLRAHAGSGDMDITGNPTRDWEARTGSGSIDLHVPGQASFEIDAESSSGSVTMNRPVTIEGTMKRNRLSGKVGNGGPAVRLHTGSGDIEVN